MRNSKDEMNFWRGRRVLITGHTGFKGSWFALWLTRLGAEVVGIGLLPNTSPNLYELSKIKNFCESHYCDIRDADSIKKLISKAQAEIIFHFAAQALVHESYRNPLDTFSTNVMGTANVLNALREVDDTQVVIVVTTDKVYRNNEWNWPYREDDILGGHDPYSASKAASELVIECYRKAFLANQGIKIASARAGNVIGGGDWSADRLIPDAIRAWHAGNTMNIRNPHAVRPWQHVLEPLSGYMSLAIALSGKDSISGDKFESFNFGPSVESASRVKDVIDLALKYYGKGVVNYDRSESTIHEASTLMLETSKARMLLGITPKWTLDESVRRTMQWYRSQQEGKNVRNLCESEISDYEQVK